MSITYGNPIVITSGTLNSEIVKGNINVKNVYWHQPTLASTSSLIITKKTAAGITYLNLACETSGQSQTLEPKDWMKDPYCRCMPTGTLYIYLD